MSCITWNMNKDYIPLPDIIAGIWRKARWRAWQLKNILKSKVNIYLGQGDCLHITNIIYNVNLNANRTVVMHIYTTEQPE